ncbi:MAG: invasion associated locus B family protein [Alkalilacustris sp.]
MTRFGSSIVLATAMALAPATATLAQDSDAPLPGTGLPLGEEVTDGMGDTYVAEEFGDWTKLCQRVPDGSDPCGLTQLMTDPDGAPVAEITIFPLPPGGEAVAGANMITPLGTLLPQQIGISVDGGTVRRYPFLFCDVSGCYAQIGLTAAMVESFRRGNEATVTIVSVAAPDQPVELSLSLNGFTAGYSALPQPGAN